MQYQNLKNIRVGTTGDYPPFTWIDHNTEFMGEDIALFQAFAATQGYTLTWIKTTWPDLSKDLEAGLFEAAIGGISASLPRQEQFLLSSSIREDAKVILCHRDFAPYFANKAIDEYDHPEISFIYNPGGTNEATVKTRLTRARLSLETDMENIFKRLQQKEVMAFITDIHEAVYRSSKSGGGLVTVNAASPLLKTAMVALFRTDQQTLRNQFNDWLTANRVLPQ